MENENKPTNTGWHLSWGCPTQLIAILEFYLLTYPPIMLVKEVMGVIMMNLMTMTKLMLISKKPCSSCCKSEPKTSHLSRVDFRRVQVDWWHIYNDEVFYWFRLWCHVCVHWTGRRVTVWWLICIFAEFRYTVIIKVLQSAISQTQTSTPKHKMRELERGMI